jgi:hypothetical protein
MDLVKELLSDKCVYFVVECVLLNLGDMSLIMGQECENQLKSGLFFEGVNA